MAAIPLASLTKDQIIQLNKTPDIHSTIPIPQIALNWKEILKIAQEGERRQLEDEVEQKRATQEKHPTFPQKEQNQMQVADTGKNQQEKKQDALLSLVYLRHRLEYQIFSLTYGIELGDEANLPEYQHKLIDAEKSLLEVYKNLQDYAPLPGELPIPELLPTPMTKSLAELISGSDVSKMPPPYNLVYLRHNLEKIYSDSVKNIDFLTNQMTSFNAKNIGPIVESDLRMLKVHKENLRKLYKKMSFYAPTPEEPIPEE